MSVKDNLLNKQYNVGVITWVKVKYMLTITQKSRREKQDYIIVRFLYYMRTSVITFDDQLQEVKDVYYKP